MLMGFIIFGIMSIGFAFFATSLTIWILFAVYGLYMAMTDGVSRAYVSDMVAEKRRGTALGAYNALVGITILPANFIGGFLWHSLNVSAPFIYAAILSFLSCFLMVFLLKNK